MICTQRIKGLFTSNQIINGRVLCDHTLMKFIDFILIAIGCFRKYIGVDHPLYFAAIFWLIDKLLFGPSHIFLISFLSVRITVFLYILCTISISYLFTTVHTRLKQRAQLYSIPVVFVKLACISEMICGQK